VYGMDRLFSTWRVASAAFVSLVLVLPDGSVWADDNQAQVEVPAEPQLTPAEMLSQATSNVARMRGVSESIAASLAAAQEKKDIILANCLSDKLRQVEANQAVAEDAVTQLRVAVDAKDDDDALHRYSSVTIVGQKLESLRVEAESCAGEDLGYVGDTETSVEEGADLRRDNVTSPGLLQGFAVAYSESEDSNPDAPSDPGGAQGTPIARPPSASPFR